MFEKELLNKALSVLKKNTGVEVKQLELQTDSCPDATVELIKSELTQDFLVYVKRSPSISKVGLLTHNFQESLKKNGDTKMLLVADYVSPNLSQFLKDNNCDFIDSVGNTYLEFGSVLIYLSGNKRPKLSSGTTSSRAFQTTGLKLIFALLCHPEKIINRSYRELSEISGVSLGSVGWIISDLKTAGYLSLGDNNQRKWVDKEGLIERWVVAYPEKLRPKLVIGYYRSLKDSWQNEVDITSYGAFWGGEVAADYLTRYLKPEVSTIYSEDSPGKLILMNSLKEASEQIGGNVEILQKFWNFSVQGDKRLVPALLIYADLVASGNSRNLEAAKLINEDYIDGSE